jgi:hypothetical protein
LSLGFAITAVNARSVTSSGWHTISSADPEWIGLP